MTIFEKLDTEEALNRFEDSIWKERHVKNGNGYEEADYITRFERKIHQIKVLEKLQFERDICS